MKEAVLNKMNPKERKILEAELQKVYTKQTHSFRDAGKAVWNTKGIRELLDGCTEYAGCYFKCNIALLQAFEKERQMEEEDEEEDLGWKEEFAPCRSRKLPCYTIGRENVSKKFCIPNVLTALILSGDMGMLEYGFDHYKLENPVVCRGKIEALGEALLYGDETKRTGN